MLIKVDQESELGDSRRHRNPSKLLAEDLNSSGSAGQGTLDLLWICHRPERLATCVAPAYVRLLHMWRYCQIPTSLSGHVGWFWIDICAVIPGLVFFFEVLVALMNQVCIAVRSGELARDIGLFGNHHQTVHNQM